VAKKQQKKKISVSTLGAVAEVFSVNLDTVNRWRAEGMPGDRGSWVLHDISTWLRSEGPWRQNAKAQIADTDPLLEDGDSPALERYRLAKAKLAELDLETRKGQLIERDKARDIFSRWAVLVRRMGERLSKRFGPDAAATVNETLDSCRAAVLEVVES
jgi:phage terminase Nu1 subunit (DNA packaging protein)